jgi:hypothetical protein
MDHVPMKRRRMVIPKPLKFARAGVWDDDGGVFTQENPPINARSKSKLI